MNQKDFRLRIDSTNCTSMIAGTAFLGKDKFGGIVAWNLKAVKYMRLLASMDKDVGISPICWEEGWILRT